MTTTLTATAEPSNAWVRLEVVTDEVDATWATITRTINGQDSFVRWGKVAQLTGGTDLTVLDAEAPYDEAATYAVEVLDSTGIPVGAGDTAGPVTLTDDGSDRLIFLGGPGLVLPVTVTSFPEVSTSSRNGVFDIIGRRNRVAVTDVRSGESGSVTVLVEDRGEALRSLLQDGSLVALRTPTDRGYGTPSIYSVGDVRTRRVGLADDPLRLVEAQVVEVDAPAVTSEGSSAISWAALIAAFATWQDVIDAYATWYEVVTIPASDL